MRASDHYRELYADAMDDPGAELDREDAALDAWFEARRRAREAVTGDV